MKIKLYLHGHLKTKVQKDFVEVEAITMHDALQALAHLYQKELKAPLDIGRWKIKIKNYETRESWFVPLYTEEAHLYPVFRTAKSNWLSVAVGVTLMAVAVFATGGLGAAMATAIGSTGLTVGGLTFSAGLALTMSGIMNLLYPAPTLNTSNEASSNSKYLGAQGNTAAAGTRIPFGYGLFKVSGHYISYNVTSTLLRVISKEVD